MKFQYFLKKVHFKKNDIVYRQGSKCDMVYIVKSGEFQLTITQDLQRQKKFQYSAYIGPKCQREKKIINQDGRYRQKKQSNTTKISIM